MSDENPTNSTALPDDDRRTGEPIGVLKELEHDTSPFFLRNIRRKIYRRTTASHLLLFSWQIPKIAFVELGGMIAHIFSALNIRKGD